jgi:uncharacterized protein YuzE
MKLSYYQETDSLYIDLASRASAESREISEGVVLDYDANGNLVGIDIDHASRKLNLHELVTSHMPAASVAA